MLLLIYLIYRRAKRIGVLNVHYNSDGEASKKGSNKFPSLSQIGKWGCVVLTSKSLIWNRLNKSEMAMYSLQIIPALRRNSLS